MTKIFSRKEIEWECLKEKIPSDIVIISIRNHGDMNRMLIDSLPNEKLILRFDDIESLQEDGLPPNIDHLKQIVEFAKKNENKEIWVHCNGGISRSSATALCIEFLKNKNAKKCVQDLLDVKIHFPNFLVLNIFCNIIKDRGLIFEVDEFKKLAFAQAIED